MKRNFKVVLGTVLLFVLWGFSVDALAVPEYYPTTGRTIHVPHPSGLVHSDDAFWVLSRDWSVEPAIATRLYKYSAKPDTWGQLLGDYSVPQVDNVQGLAWDLTHWWIVDNSGWTADKINKCELTATGLNVVQSYDWPYSGPVSVEWAQSYLWVADNHTDVIYRVTVGDTSFTSVEPWSSGNISPYGLAWDGTHMWSLCSPAGGGTHGPREIYKHDVNGDIIEIWHYPPVNEPVYGGAGLGLAIADKRLYYSDYYSNQIIELVPIPAPGALVLGGIGVGFVGWLRRRKAV